MAVSRLASGTITTSASEQSLLASDEQTPGAYELHIDLNAMIAGDTIVFRVKEKVLETGTLRTALYNSYSGAQTDPTNKVIGPIAITNALNVTVIRTAGSDRAIPWEIRRIG